MSDILTIGLIATFVFYLLAHATLLDKPLGWPREHCARLIGCSFCAGFWITGALTFLGGYDWRTHLAAAAVVGILGGYTNG